MTLVVIGLYLLLVIGIGIASRTRFLGTGEDFFLASRTIGPTLLLLSLFGTHMTAFSLLGASGEAYHRGIGVFALMASSSALVVPAVFLFVGIPLWRQARRHGFVTQVDYFRARWGSDGVAWGLLALLTVFLVPYLLIGIKGGGITLHQITRGGVPEWAGSLAICVVVLVYVTAGGVRGTAWANAFQTLVFMILGGVTAWIIVHRLGGLGPLMDRLAAEQPELLVRGDRILPLEMLTYTLVPLSVGMFPHIFMHWLTARGPSTFRLPIVAYPLCVAVVWLPSVLVGVVGAVVIPGLEGPAASSVLIRMIESHAPGILAGLLAAGVFAAVMSSMDSQSLALGTLLVRALGERDGTPESRRVALGRGAVAVVLVATFLLSQVVDRSIFKLGIWSFSGFAALFPLVVAAIYWRRSNAMGASAALATVAVLWPWFLHRAWTQPGYTVAGSGVMPVTVLVAASALALVIGSLASAPLPVERVAPFFEEADA